MKAEIILGDCLIEMPKMPENSVDAIVTDPPYALTGASRNGSARANDPGKPHGRHALQSGGFMGMKWDSVIPGVAFWQEALRVAKPGAHMLAFGGTRTFHRLACAIEDAGWEIRDDIAIFSEPNWQAFWESLSPDQVQAFLNLTGGNVLAWLYGSGFPKSLDVSKRLRKAGRSIENPKSKIENEWSGWGTGLKPAWEPIILARKPISEKTVAANVLKWGTGALNVDAGRLPSDPWKRPTMNDHRGGKFGAHETKPIRIERVGASAGRWPSNVLLDECAAAMLDEQSGERESGGYHRVRHADRNRNCFSLMKGTECPEGFRRNSGGASRFFYITKASRAEREAGLEGFEPRRNDFQRPTSGLARPNVTEGKYSEKARTHLSEPGRNHHPTVKPIKLLEYLIRLISPPDGLILDPFAGSGSTGCAAVKLGFGFIGIEKEADYCAIARARIAHWQSQAALPLLENQPPRRQNTKNNPDQKVLPSLVSSCLGGEGEAAQ